MATPIELTAEDIIPPAAAESMGGFGDMKKIERILKTVDRAITLVERLPFFQQQQQKTATIQPLNKYPVAITNTNQPPPQQEPQPPTIETPQQAPPQQTFNIADLSKYFKSETEIIAFIKTILDAMPPTIKLKDVATLLNQVFAQFGDYTAADAKMMFSAFKPILRLALKKEFEKVKK